MRDNTHLSSFKVEKHGEKKREKPKNEHGILQRKTGEKKIEDFEGYNFSILGVFKKGFQN